MLTEKIREIHAASRGTYGAPHVHAALQAEGMRVGKKRVARLMKGAGLRGVSRRRRPSTTIRAEGKRPAPDLVERISLSATSAPTGLTNSGWRTSPTCRTYVPTRAGFLYLAVVLDAFSRRIVGWAMASHLRTELAALDMAAQQRRPEGTIHHSDQGSQYTAIAFGQRCKDAGVRPSMGSVGDCYDNALCESFFATLECELVDRESYSNRTEARLSLFDYIEGWYNPRRIHSSRDYRSPMSYGEEYYSREHEQPEKYRSEERHSLVAA